MKWVPSLQRLPVMYQFVFVFIPPSPRRAACGWDVACLVGKGQDVMWKNRNGVRRTFRSVTHWAALTIPDDRELWNATRRMWRLEEQEAAAARQRRTP